jgi:putative SOS response-associated peptidase YedK
LGTAPHERRAPHSQRTSLPSFADRRSPIADRRPPERESCDEAVSDFEVVEPHFGLLPGFATEVKYGTRTYNARSETVASLSSFK